jgi:hypothetical protein
MALLLNIPETSFVIFSNNLVHFQYHGVAVK